MIEEPPLDIDLTGVIFRFRTEIDVRDRKKFSRLYNNCFVGSQAVDWILKQPHIPKCDTRQQAVIIGQRMMDDGVFYHVSHDHLFQDKNYFYRFNTEEVAEIEKKERQSFSKSGWVQKKGLISWNSQWLELKGNTLNWYDGPRGHHKGTLNTLGCTIKKMQSVPNGFELVKNSKSLSLKTEDPKTKNEWISMISRATDKTLNERTKMLAEWNKEGECVGCIATDANEQAELEEEAEELIETDSRRQSTIEQDFLAELTTIPLVDLEDKPVTFKDVFTKDIIVLALLRHFG
eukprot:TRINITY_DN2487_c0_g1_i1.p1 TRINITY_DN2487_c0_g1~~TRINITY_DN2487_c0_g1_i1.p1  ORF type:complete len:290 (-),score=73.83 TRINITY_DN2487_c0_g1_i1:515-1384(-)